MKLIYKIAKIIPEIILELFYIATIAIMCLMPYLYRQ